MTEFIKLQTPEKTIQIGFTDQKVSGRAGLLTFAGFLHWHRFGALLALVLPHRRTSKKAIPVADLALGFLAGILAGAQKLAHPAHLRNDVMLPALLAIQRIGSQSTFTRFFQGFTSAGRTWPPSVPLALVPGAAAQSPRRLQPGPGLDPAPARGRPPGGRGHRLHPPGHQTVPASAGGGARGGQAGGRLLVATGQRQLRQQRGRLHPGIAGAAAQRGLRSARCAPIRVSACLNGSICSRPGGSRTSWWPACSNRCNGS
ncbi:MAG: transposase [Verrucomicrobiales bacterium]|nr:transposase [Verrucomicrobiales bacterium]